MTLELEDKKQVNIITTTLYLSVDESTPDGDNDSSIPVSALRIGRQLGQRSAKVRREGLGVHRVRDHGDLVRFHAGPGDRQ